MTGKRREVAVGTGVKGGQKRKVGHNGSRVCDNPTLFSSLRRRGKKKFGDGDI